VVLRPHYKLSAEILRRADIGNPSYPALDHRDHMNLNSSDFWNSLPHLWKTPKRQVLFPKSTEAVSDDQEGRGRDLAEESTA
jgi:hypothetical protein